MNIDLILFDDKLNLYNFLFKKHLKKSVTELSLIFLNRKTSFTLMEVLCWKKKNIATIYGWMVNLWASLHRAQLGYRIYYSAKWVSTGR